MVSYTNGIKLMLIGIDEIRICPNQPRRYFDPESMQELCDSIRSYGIIEPVCVRRVRGKYELIAGERRIRAARMAGIKKVPCVVRYINKEAACAMTLIENLQRKNLTFFEEGSICMRLINRSILTRAQLAERLGCKEKDILAKVKALELCDEVKQVIVKYNLNEYHAEAISALKEKDMQVAVARIAGENSLNDEKTKDLVYKIKHDGNLPVTEPKRKQVVKNERIYINTIKNTIAMMNSAGIYAKSSEQTEGDFIKFTIEIKR